MLSEGTSTRFSRQHSRGWTSKRTASSIWKSPRTMRMSLMATSRLFKSRRLGALEPSRSIHPQFATRSSPSWTWWPKIPLATCTCAFSRLRRSALRNLQTIDLDRFPVSSTGNGRGPDERTWAPCGQSLSGYRARRLCASSAGAALMRNSSQISFVGSHGTVTDPTRPFCGVSYKHESAFSYERSSVYLLKTHCELSTCWHVMYCAAARCRTRETVFCHAQNCAT